MHCLRMSPGKSTTHKQLLSLMWPAVFGICARLSIQRLERIKFFLAFALVVFFCAGPGKAATIEAVSPPLVIGASVAPLNGPWRFHVGDNPRWADPAFHDDDWESVDLTPKPGAHDGDVGLTGYVPGWNWRGHRGYWGYAWYRMRVSASAPATIALALTGPPAVDSVYELYFNGQLLGGAGDLTRRPPRVFGAQPRMFNLPAGSRDGVVAIRVWAGAARVAATSDAGGIHIAPAIGEAGAIHDRYLLQWRQTFLGYVVDLIPSVLLAFLAVMTASLMAIDPKVGAYRWLLVGLLLVSAARFNQVVMFWMQIEDGQTYGIVRRVLIEPLALGAWTMTWLRWFRIARMRWIPVAVAGLTLGYLTSEFLAGSWRPAAPPSFAAASLHAVSAWLRLGFASLFGLIAGLAIEVNWARASLGLMAMATSSAFLFGPELGEIGVREIWFPFGVGVSLSEYACVALVPILFALLLWRLIDFARNLKEAHRPI